MERFLPAARQHVLRSAAVAVVALAALASGSASLAGTGSSVSIAPTAYYADGPIDVTVTIQCGSLVKEVFGSVDVTVDQTAAQSGAGIAASGSGASPVNCDGAPHKVAVTVAPGAFNIGDATATATLVTGKLNKVTDTRTIHIVNS